MMVNQIALSRGLCATGGVQVETSTHRSPLITSIDIVNRAFVFQDSLVEGKRLVVAIAAQCQIAKVRQVSVIG